MAPAKDSKRTLGVFSIGLMTAAAVVTSLRGLPLLAKEEMTMFAYLAFTVVFYLIPASLVSAELGGAFAEKKGGIYAWVGKAFGTRWGFLAIWLQWIQNVVWYPITLTFGAVALAYTIGLPDLAKNGLYVGLFCIVVYWLATFVVLQGVEALAKIANWTFLIGTVLPGAVLLLLFGYWIVSGHAIGWQHLTDPAVSDNGQARFWPSINGLGTVAFLAGIVLLFAGVEVQAVHVVDMKNPKTGFPAAIGLAAIVSLLLYAIGAVPVAAILPYAKISLQSGVFDTFNAVITDVWHIGWLAQFLALLVGIGAIAGVFAWLGSPSKGLLATAHDGNLPRVLHATNDHGMPTHILIVQGVGRHGHVQPVFCHQGRLGRLLPGLGDDGRALSGRLHADVRRRYSPPLQPAETCAAIQGAGRNGRHVAGRRHRLPRRSLQLPGGLLPARSVAGGLARSLRHAGDRRHRGVLRRAACSPRDAPAGLGEGRGRAAGGIGRCPRQPNRSRDRSPMRRRI